MSAFAPPRGLSAAVAFVRSTGVLPSVAILTIVAVVVASAVVGPGAPLPEAIRVPSLFLWSLALLGTAFAVVAAGMVTQGLRRLGGALFVTAGTLAGYSLLIVVADRIPVEWPYTSWIVAAVGAAYVPSIAALACSVLVAAQEIRADPIAHRWTRWALAASSTLAIVTGLGVADPAEAYPGVAAPLANTWMASSVVQVAFAVCTVLWMLSLALPALALWRSLSRVPQALRGRIGVLLGAVLAPVWTVATCVAIVLVAGVSGFLSMDAVSLVMSVAFAVPFAVVLATVVIAVDLHADRVPVAARFVTVVAAPGAFAVVGAALAAAVGLALSASRGVGIVAGIVAVLSSAALVALAARTIRNSLIRRVDPVAARARELVAEASHGPWRSPRLAARVVVRELFGPDARLAFRVSRDGWVDDLGTPLDGEPSRGVALVSDVGDRPVVLLRGTVRGRSGEANRLIRPLVIAAAAEVSAVAGRRQSTEPDHSNIGRSPTPSSRDALLPGLTPREREVLAGLGEGRTNAAIADKLGVSERTVDTHVTAVLGKLGIEAHPDVNRRVLAANIWNSGNSSAHAAADDEDGPTRP